MDFTTATRRYSCAEMCMTDWVEYGPSRCWRISISCVEWKQRGRRVVSGRRDSNHSPAGSGTPPGGNCLGLDLNPFAVSSWCLTGLAPPVLQIHTSAPQAQIRPVETPIVAVIGNRLPAVQRGFQGRPAIAPKMRYHSAVGNTEVGTKPNVKALDDQITGLDRDATRIVEIIPCRRFEASIDRVTLVSAAAQVWATDRCAIDRIVDAWVLPDGA